RPKKNFSGQAMTKNSWREDNKNDDIILFSFYLNSLRDALLSSGTKVYSERNESVLCDDNRLLSRNRFVRHLRPNLFGQEVFCRLRHRIELTSLRSWSCCCLYRVG